MKTLHDNSTINRIYGGIDAQENDAAKTLRQNPFFNMLLVLDVQRQQVANEPEMVILEKVLENSRRDGVMNWRETSPDSPHYATGRSLEGLTAHYFSRSKKRSYKVPFSSLFNPDED